MNAALGTVKACVFDTFGTVVDWRSAVIADATSWGTAKGLNINWVEFADRWRMGYAPAMNKVRKGDLPWTSLDDLQRMILERLLEDYKIEGLSEEEKIEWVHVWRRLNPWPKPDRDMYLSAPLYLDLKPEEIAMCAAHVGDLKAAHSYGLRTCFIHRPNEYGGGAAGVPGA